MVAKIIQFLKNIIRSKRILWRKLAGDHQVLLEEMPDCPALFHVYRMMIATGHKRVPGGWIYEDEFYPEDLTAGGNSFAIRRTALKYCNGKGIDIGAAFWPLPGSIPIDTEQGPGTANRIEDIPENSQDYVFSSHCLEHIEHWNAALDTWISKLKSGGILFLYLPHPSCKLWHVSNPFMSGIHAWAPTPEIIREALLKRGLTIIDSDDGPDHFYSFFICGKK
jgi:SAM-dependent methyltransferase